MKRLPLIAFLACLFSGVASPILGDGASSFDQSSWATNPPPSSAVGEGANMTGGAANAVVYTNGSTNLTTSSAFTFDGTNLTVPGSVNASAWNVGGSTNTSGYTVRNSSGIQAQFDVGGSDASTTTWRNALLIRHSSDTIHFLLKGSATPAATMLMGTSQLALGINTTAPASPLHVVGDNAIGTLTLDNGAGATNPFLIRIRQGGSSTGLIYSAVGANNFLSGSAVNDFGFLTPSTSTKMHLGAGQSIASAPNMTITTSGTSPRVGIGTTSPTEMLDMAGLARVWNRTTAQIDAITPGGPGSLVFNTTLAQLCVSTGTGAGAFIVLNTGSATSSACR